MTPFAANRIALPWFASLLLWLLLATPVQAAAPIAAFKAEYDLYYDDDKVGQSTLELAARDNDEWLFETRSEASLYFMSFSDHEQSRFVWHNERPKPLAFSKERKRPGKTERVQQQFDWQSQTDRGTRGKKSWSTALLGDTHDLQSHLLALQLDLRAGKHELMYAVSRHGRVRQYQYKISKEEVLDTALGRLSTLRVERIRDADDDRQTISWLAPSLDFIPVRIQQFEKGELQGDMRIRKLTR